MKQYTVRHYGSKALFEAINAHAGVLGYSITSECVEHWMAFWEAPGKEDNIYVIIEDLPYLSCNTYGEILSLEEFFKLAHKPKQTRLTVQQIKEKLNIEGDLIVEE